MKKVLLFLFSLMLAACATTNSVNSDSDMSSDQEQSIDNTSVGSSD